MNFGKTAKPKRKFAAEHGANNGGEMRIYISPVMFVMAAYFVIMGMAYEFACSLAAVLLHECAHARVAKKFGYELNVVKLMPYGAALCGDADMRPRHEAVIALAGPLVNITVATLFAAVWWLLPSSYMFTQAFCYSNLYIGIFNLIPVYPLDGGRILLAALSAKLKRGKAYKAVRMISAMAGAVMLALFGVTAVYSFNLCLLSVGIFMIVSALIPDKRAKYNALFALSNRRDRIKTPLRIKRFAVSDEAMSADVCNALDPDGYSEFVVLSDDMRVRGVIDETVLIESVKSHGYSEKMGDILNRKIRTVE